MTRKIDVIVNLLQLPKEKLLVHERNAIGIHPQTRAFHDDVRGRGHVAEDICESVVDVRSPLRGGIDLISSRLGWFLQGLDQVVSLEHLLQNVEMGVSDGIPQVGGDWGRKYV